MIIFKCDKCGYLSEPQEGTSMPKDANGRKFWSDVVIRSSRGRVKTFHLCPPCKKKLNIPDDFNEAQANMADNLMEILTEIAQDAAAAVIAVVSRS